MSVLRGMIGGLGVVGAAVLSATGYESSRLGGSYPYMPQGAIPVQKENPLVDENRRLRRIVDDLRAKLNEARSRAIDNCDSDNPWRYDARKVREESLRQQRIKRESLVRKLELDD